MHPEEIRNKIFNFKNEGKSVAEISRILGMKYQTVRFILKPKARNAEHKMGRPCKINSKSKKTINECVKRLKR